MFERSLEESDISYRSIVFSSGPSLRNCLLRGMGISICPVISVRSHLDNGELITLQTSDLPIETPVLMIYHIDKWCSPLLKHFLDCVKHTISPAP